MSGACPECGTAIPAAREGATVPCPRCRNPVLVVYPEERRTPPPAAAAPPEASPPRAGGSWGMVLAALAVLALANLGLWLLLTVGARAGVARAEDRFAPEEMDPALEAGVPEASGDLKADLRRKELWETARAWDADRRHVSMVGYALFGAYVLQAGLIVLLRLRSAPRPKRRGASLAVGAQAGMREVDEEVDA